MKKIFIPMFLLLTFFVNCQKGVSPSLVGSVWYAEIEEELTGDQWKLNLEFKTANKIILMASEGRSGFQLECALKSDGTKWFATAKNEVPFEILIEDLQITIDSSALKSHWAISKEKLNFTRVK